MNTLSQRIRDAAEALKVPSNDAELFQLRYDKPDAFARMAALVEDLEAWPAKLQAIICEDNPEPIKQLTSAERGVSLAHALYAVVAERGACELSTGSVFDLVLELVDPDDRPFWEATGSQVIFGLISSKDNDLIFELAERGIMAEAQRADDGIAYEIRLAATADFVDPPPSVSAESGREGPLAEIPKNQNPENPPSTDGYPGSKTEQAIKL